ncbi:MAG: hypothetical protein RSE13_22620 [Planktothrix sp. GU0601_MAG3]|nr:MAG: hypothetical protein RSE13_22620 [Planktothrix sp. GU0601_MAG3]
MAKMILFFPPKLLSILCFLLLSPTPTSAQEQQPQPPDLNPTLKIGVVQHFGDKPSDQLILKAQPGDHLTLQFQTPQGEKQLQTESVILKMGFETPPATGS